MNYDIFFISFNESNQEKNWSRVLELHPTAIRLHGIKGIDKVHLACNDLSTTEKFWTVDGDNWLTESLAWDAEVPADLLMFQATDPITNKGTKLGGVKLWTKNKFINKDMSKGDFCLNATETRIGLLKSFSYTNYNASKYEAWKTAFRHCVKLMSSIISDRPLAKNIEAYLEHWRSCSTLDNGKNNAAWAYCGYQDAENFVKQNKDLNLINDYSWLNCYFKEKYE
jgi:hypothetical protein